MRPTAPPGGRPMHRPTLLHRGLGRRRRPGTVQRQGRTALLAPRRLPLPLPQPQPQPRPVRGPLVPPAGGRSEPRSKRARTTRCPGSWPYACGRCVLGAPGPPARAPVPSHPGALTRPPLQLAHAAAGDDDFPGCTVRVCVRVWVCVCVCVCVVCCVCVCVVCCVCQQPSPFFLSLVYMHHEERRSDC